MPTLWTSHGPGGGGSFFQPVISPNGQELWVDSDMSGIYRSRDFGQSWQMQPFHKSIGGVDGGRNSQVVATSDSSILYIANTARGLVKSTDGGVTWTTVSGWTNGTAYWMAADPVNAGKIIVASGSNLYLSANGGTSFSLAYSSSNLYVAGAFWQGSSVYIGSNKGLLTSTNGGSSFTASAMPNGQAISSLTGAMQGTTTRLMALTTSSSPGPGGISGDYGSSALYRLDVGGSWTKLTVPTGNNVRVVAMAQNNTSTVYLGGTDASAMTQVLKTSDGGATWSDVFRTGGSADGGSPNQNIYTGYEGRSGDFDYGWGGFWGLTVAPYDANRVFESDYGFLHTTSDGGTWWHEAYASSGDANPPGVATPKHKAYHGIGIEDTSVKYLQWLSPTSLFAGYTDTIGFRSTDGGASWAAPTWNGLATNTVYSTQLAADGKLYGASSNVHDMYASNYLNDARCNPMISTGQSFNQDGRVIVSTDQGSTWSLIKDFAHPVVWVQLDPSNANRMYASVVDGPGSASAGAYGGVWVTNNLNLGASSTWTKLANPPRTQGHPYSIRVLNDGALVVSYSARRAGSPEAFTQSSGVFYSTDGGTTWQDRTLIYAGTTYGAPDMSYYTREVTIDPTDPTQNTWYAGVFSGWGGKGNETGDVYRTTDRGLHWTRMQLYRSNAYPRGSAISVYSVTIDPVTHGMFVTTETSGMMYTPDVTKAGLTYTDFTDVTSFPFWGPDRVFINPYDDRDVWVVTFGGGMWEGGVGPDTVSAVALSATQVQVNWADNSANEASFEIDRATDANFTQNLATTVAPANATSATIAGLNGSTTYYFRVRAVNGTQKSANSGTATLATPPADTTPPVVSSVQVSDGAAQRSMLKKITVTFSEQVGANSAFRLYTRQGVLVGDVTIGTTQLADGVSWELAFSGPSVVGHSLPDGMYELRVLAANVIDAAGNAMSADYSYRFHRLFGDGDGDRDVDSLDLNQFRAAMRRPVAYWWLDYNEDGAINTADLLQLKSRLTRRVL